VKPFDMSQECVLITGASSGLGQHFAAVLARRGARVILAARRVEKLEQTLADIELNGGRGHLVSLDVTSSDSVDSAVSKVWDQFGPVSVLINNAGIARPGSTLELTEEQWDQVLDTNLKGCWLMARQCARQWIASSSEGNIVNIASIAGLHPGGQLAAYGASKAGLLSLTKSLALEWARYNIRVNALAPGYVLTDMNREFFDSAAGEAMRKRIPQRRIGELTDLDGPLLLLASAGSRAMTGSVLVVDGGHLQRGL
jgi:NAD(P)-dependent dehydrogenase (short-subunit alcohol dehydrogenase family)